MTDDLKALSDGELEQLAQAVEAERRRRLVLALTPVQMDELREQVASALGREPGAPWVQPTGAHDAYAVGNTVTHKGKLWESVIAWNTTIPGNPADPQAWRWWRKVVPPDPDPPQVRPWKLGATFVQGERCTYGGKTYELLQATHTVVDPGWTPPAVPAIWREVPA